MEKLQYSSCFSGSYIPYREKIEWANYWWDEANTPASERILMIGDSTSRFYRGIVAKKLKCAVDFLGTCSAITDLLFRKELDLFFSMTEYQYDFIHLQLGVHGIVPEGKQVLLEDCPDYYRYYEKDYRQLVVYLKSKCKKLVLGTITPVIVWKQYTNPLYAKLYTHLHRKSDEVLDGRFDQGIKQRNGILIKIAKEQGVQVNDLYKLMSVGEGKNFRHTDHVHYEKIAKNLFADRLISYYRGKDI